MSRKNQASVAPRENSSPKMSAAMVALAAAGFSGKVGQLNVTLIDTLYGAGGPLYDLVAPIGVPSLIVNGINDAFATYAEVLKNTQPGQAAYTVSMFDDREVFSMAVNTGEGIAYFSIMHDADGEPIEQVAEETILVKAKTNRDFSIEQDGKKIVILQKGTELHKAVDVAYFGKMKQA